MLEERRVVLQNHWAVTGQIRKCEASFWPYLNAKISHERQQDCGYKSKRSMGVRKVMWCLALWINNDANGKCLVCESFEMVGPYCCVLRFTATHWTSSFIFVVASGGSPADLCRYVCALCACELLITSARCSTSCIALHKNVSEPEMQFNIHWQNKGSTCRLKIGQKHVF